MPTDTQQDSPSITLLKIFQSPDWAAQDISKSKEVISEMMEVLRNEKSKLDAREASEITLLDSSPVRISFVALSLYPFPLNLHLLSRTNSKQAANTSISGPALGRASSNLPSSPLSRLPPYRSTHSKAPVSTSNDSAPHGPIIGNISDSRPPKASTPVIHNPFSYEQSTGDKAKQSSRAVVVNNSDDSSPRQVSDGIDNEEDWASREVLVRNAGPPVSYPSDSGPATCYDRLSTGDPGQPRRYLRPRAVMTTRLSRSSAAPAPASSDNPRRSNAKERRTL